MIAVRAVRLLLGRLFVRRPRDRAAPTRVAVTPPDVREQERERAAALKRRADELELRVQTVQRQADLIARRRPGRREGSG